MAVNYHGSGGSGVGAYAWKIDRVTFDTNGVLLRLGVKALFPWPTDGLLKQVAGKDWIHIDFNKAQTFAGRVSVPLSGIGPTVYLDFYSNINDNYGLYMDLHIRGTGIIGRLDVQRTFDVDDSALKSGIELFQKKIC